jgi:hypothetical protein
MTDSTKVAINVVISCAALLTFIVLYAFEIWRAWKGRISPMDPINDRVAYLATAVSGLVAAIVATALSLPPPSTSSEPPQNKQNPPPKTEEAPEASVFSMYISELGDTVAGESAEKKWKDRLGLAYVIAYVAIGLGAMATWVVRDASSLIKAQALTFIGLMLAAARLFLTS